MGSGGTLDKTLGYIHAAYLFLSSCSSGPTAAGMTMCQCGKQQLCVGLSEVCSNLT